MQSLLVAGTTSLSLGRPALHGKKGASNRRGKNVAEPKIEYYHYYFIIIIHFTLTHQSS
jgi:hypothetical protein